MENNETIEQHIMFNLPGRGRYRVLENVGCVDQQLRDAITKARDCFFAEWYGTSNFKQTAQSGTPEAKEKNDGGVEVTL